MRMNRLMVFLLWIVHRLIFGYHGLIVGFLWEVELLNYGDFTPIDDYTGDMILIDCQNFFLLIVGHGMKVRLWSWMILLV